MNWKIEDEKDDDKNQKQIRTAKLPIRQDMIVNTSYVTFYFLYY